MVKVNIHHCKVSYIRPDFFIWKVNKRSADFTSKSLCSWMCRQSSGRTHGHRLEPRTASSDSSNTTSSDIFVRKKRETLSKLRRKLPLWIWQSCEGLYGKQDGTIETAVTAVATKSDWTPKNARLCGSAQWKFVTEIQRVKEWF